MFGDVVTTASTIPTPTGRSVLSVGWRLTVELLTDRIQGEENGILNRSGSDGVSMVDKDFWNSLLFTLTYDVLTKGNEVLEGVTGPPGHSRA